MLTADQRYNRGFDAASLRATVLRMAFAGSTVHIACAFSLVEILAVLYRSHLNFPDGDPEHPDRDLLVLSKGHGVMAQYACMYELGWLDDQDIDTYFGDGTHLKGLSDSRVRGLEVTSGSLGHGLSVGVGMAMARKLRGSEEKTYIIVGDGEINEGPIWEGLLFAAHHRLRNLMVIIDQNGHQAMGRTDEVMELGDIAQKLDSFGLLTATVDGHDEAAIDETVTRLWSADTDRPRGLVARTVKGHGVSFMANDNRWHYTRLDETTMSTAMSEVTSATAAP